MTHEDVTCPFCGLLCDNLTVRTEGHTLHPVDNVCLKARTAYAAAALTGEPRVRGNPATLDVALQAALRLLKKSKRPLLAGLGTDVNGLRATFALAEKCHARVTHMHSPALLLNLRVLQSRGWQTTTLSEVRNRADLIVLVGVDLNANFQNFIARTLAPDAALQPARRAARRLAYLGPAAQAPGDCAGLALDVIACAGDELASMLRALQGLIAGRTLNLVRGKRRTSLAALAARIKSAEYPVFAWAPGQLPAAAGDLVISGICELVSALNRSSRAAGLILGGDDGAQSALAVSSWLTGFATNVSFAGAELQWTPDATSADLLAEGADLLVYTTTFSQREPPATQVPTILVAPPGFAPAARADVYIPVGIPGIDHAGQLLRTDGVVALPLRQLRSGALLSVAQVLDRLREGLQ